MAGGKLYSYIAGTTTPQSTYTDSTSATANANPVILDSRGEAGVWLADDAFYKLSLYTADNILVWTVDQISSNITLAALAESNGSSLIGYLPAGTGAVATTVQTKLRETVSVKDFGAVGDGVTNDTTPLTNFLTAASGKKAFLPAGTYKITSLISIALTDCEIVGVPGSTIIQGSFGYALLNLLASNDVVFSGITFQNDYINATQDGAFATVYSFKSNLSNIRFENCTFSIPNANGNGLVIYLNTASTDVNTCTNLSVEYCTFLNCGRQATTFMNRSTQSGAEGFFKGLRFNNNLGKNLGLNGNYGMLISLDGVGEDFTVNNNRLENFYDLGIECAGWKNGQIIGNTFDLMSRLTKPIGLGPGGVTGTLPINVSVMLNKCMSAATSNGYLIQSSNCLVEGNYFWTNGADQALLVRSSLSNIFRDNYYKNTHPTAARYGCLYEDSAATGCYGNKSFDETFDTAGGTGNFATLRFYGTANVKQNVVYRPLILKSAGGTYYDESTGAINNLVVNGTYSASTLFGLDYVTQNFTTDADMTMTIQYYSAAVLRVTNTALTIGRNVILPSIIKTWDVINATAQTLTFKAATGTGIAVATGKSARLFWDGTNMVRITADA